MKKKTPLNSFLAKEAEKASLCIDTVKKIFKQSCINSDKADKKIFHALIAKAQLNSRKRKNKTIPDTALLVPNSYLITQLLQDRIAKHYIYDYDISNDAQYSHCIYSADDRENLKIDRDEYDKAVFFGITYTQYMLITAIYTAIDQKLYSHTKKNDWGDIVYMIQPQTIYQLVNPNKRWDKLTLKQNLDFQKKINTLTQLKLNGRLWIKGMPEAIEDDRGALLMRCTLRCGATLNDNLLSVVVNPQGLLAAAQKQKRIVCIPSDMLDYGRGSIDGALTRWYIAYRICIKSKKMQKSILLKTLDSIGDDKASRKMVKGYMQYLADAGYITDYSITRHGISWQVPEPVKQAKISLVIMHNADGKLSENAPEKTAEVKEREKLLYTFNDMSKRYNVCLNGKKIDTQLHCTYCNNNWKNGGRLYTGANGYQSLSQSDRAKLTINGHKVAELDFNGYHTHLLYAFSGVQLNSDPYSFYPIRKAAKLVLNITLNAKSKATAVAAFTAKWKELGYTPVDVNTLFANMEKRHAAITQHFYSGAGVGLQYIDSCIALNIIMAMRAKRILVLPVHDSFIVDARYAERLLEVMQNEYRKYTVGFSCPVAEKVS